MTIDSWSKESQAILANNSLTPSLDIELLIAHVQGKDRAWVLAHGDDTIDDKTLLTLKIMLKRRAAGEPIAYITNVVGFYGRDFYVDNRVLVPRPESEDFIEIMRLIVSENADQKSIIDIGTGSGILAVTLKLEHPSLEITASDISKPALEVARKNINHFKLDIQTLHQDLLSDQDRHRIVLANLPYVPTDLRDPSIRMEPDTALYSGADGLDHYRRLFHQLQNKSVHYVLTESLLGQHEQLREIAKTVGFIEFHKQGLVQAFTRSRGRQPTLRAQTQAWRQP